MVIPHPFKDDIRAQHDQLAQWGEMISTHLPMDIKAQAEMKGRFEWAGLKVWTDAVGELLVHGYKFFLN